MTHPTDPVAAMREALKFYASMSSWTLTPREGTARTMHLSDAEIDMGKRARDALALPLPAAPAPTRPRVSTAGSGQEARLVVTPAAPANDAVREARATAREVVARLLAWANERTASKNGAIRQDGFAVKNALRSIIDPADLLAAERAQDAKGGE